MTGQGAGGRAVGVRGPRERHSESGHAGRRRHYTPPALEHTRSTHGMSQDEHLAHGGATLPISPSLPKTRRRFNLRCRRAARSSHQRTTRLSTVFRGCLDAAVCAVRGRRLRLSVDASRDREAGGNRHVGLQRARGPHWPGSIIMRPRGVWTDCQPVRRRRCIDSFAIPRLSSHSQNLSPPPYFVPGPLASFSKM